MRMWMVDPKHMCRQHLLGEHLECHMFLGVVNKRGSVDGYVNNNLFEPRSLIPRHYELVREMERRGYNHKTPMAHISDELFELMYECDARINKKAALDELLRRCPRCREQHGPVG